MTVAWFNEGADQVARARVNFSLVTTQVRVLLVMSAFDFETEKDALDLDAMSLDEMDGANYGRKILANVALAKDAAANLTKFTADPTVWPLLGVGARQVAGALVYFHITDDTDAIPLMFNSSGGFPYTATGEDRTITWPAAGVLQWKARAT